MESLKRRNYLNWDEFFMSIAFISSQRSKDPSTQVGAVIVNEDNVIISLGYNGLPRGCNDDEFPWGKTGEDELNKKYFYVVHSERNAIINAYGKDLKDCKIYVMYFPCNECTKSIIQSGIKEVIYYNTYDHDNHAPEMEASMRMLNAAKIKYRQYEKSGNKINIECNNTIKSLDL